ncbi:PP2C family protein-serine/threonine phosphatase [Streptomyces sp. YS-3]|uniref:PP2C family protein-serine/threonine phosphatase n=1 Tax=Streptomyces sp. YS-3 TaxID=3381352 RepID=UPI0038628744
MDLRALLARRHPSHRLRRALLATPFALIAIISVADVEAPPDVHLGPFLAAPPALTASFAGPRTTGLVGAVAVAAQVGVAMLRGSVTDLNHSFQIISLALISVLVTLFAHLREVHERELVQLRLVAEAAQQVVLRPLRERLGPLRMASVYLAAEAEAQIGGDLYAAARTSHGTRLLIGDVRGKGLEAVGDAAVVLGAFRASAHQENELCGLVAYLEGAVGPEPDEAGAEEGEEGAGDGAAADRDDADRADADAPGEAFITAAVLDVPDDHQTLSLVNCGHPPPLILRGGRVLPLDVARPAPPLGLSELAGSEGPGEYVFTAETFAFETGDILLLYTDGVIEARDGAGAFYPLAERVGAWAATGPHTPRALLRHLCDDLLAHVPGRCLGDDAAMVAIERLG